MSSTDNVLRSHRGTAAEFNHGCGQDFRSRECRQRRSYGRAGYSLFCRYPTYHHDPPLITNPRTAIISFLAAFFLISFTIREATHDLTLELDRTDSLHSANGEHHHHHHVRERSVTKHDTRVVQVCRFNWTLPPIQLLERCNHLCMLFTAIGFILEIMAILCLAWDTMGVSVSAFATGLTLFCIIASVIVVNPISL